MKFNLKISLILLILLAVAIYFAYVQTDEPPKATLSPAQLQLATIGDKCLDFGERAVAGDTPIVEFQMLVRLAKKTDVIERCMTDNGYKANPAWLRYAEPIAKTNAIKASSSIDEALTHLRRADMQVFTPAVNRPDYWIKP